MLDGLRRIGRTWFGKLLGAFLIVGLAGFGISNVLLDFGANTVAKVGDEEITSIEFQRAYDDQMQRIAGQQGRMPTAQEAVAMGIPGATLEGLAAQAAVNQLGQTMGIGVSDERLSIMLREDPSFAGTLGQFDPASFQLVLQRSGMTESEYFDLQRKAGRRDQIVAGLLADSPAPAAADELFARYTGDQRTIDYAILNAQSIPAVAEPTEEELAAYLTERQQQFRTAETRTVDVLVLTPQTLAASEEVTEEEIVAEYDRTKEQRVRIERRTIRTAPLATDAQAGWFERGKAAGRAFEDLVAETGVAITELGTLTRAQVTDQNLGDAAFALAAPGDFAIIPGIGGQRVVTVSAIEPGGQVSLEEVREEIRTQLAVTKARIEYNEILDQIEELRAALQPLGQIAERFGLEVTEVALTADGSALAVVPGLPTDLHPRVAAAAFSAEEGRLVPTVATGATSNIWLDLKGVEPARDQTLEEVREAVAAAIVEERTSAAIAAEAEEIISRIKAGEPFVDVVFALNLLPNLSTPFGRQGDGTPVIDVNVASAVFAGGEGHAGSAVNSEGDYVIFQVAEIVPGAATLGQDTFLEEITRTTLYNDFVRGLRQDAGLRVNQQTLNQILALDSSVQ